MRPFLMGVLIYLRLEKEAFGEEENKYGEYLLALIR